MSKRNMTTSILGDAGSAEATVVPNLESLNAGSDQYVTSISDTSEFNVFGQMKIYDNYWDSFFARHIVNSANAGTPSTVTKNAIIQSNTEGWCRADHMVLAVPVMFEYTHEFIRTTNLEDTTGNAIDAAKSIFDAALVADPTGATYPWASDFQNNSALTFDRTNIDRMVHSWFGVIDVFNKIRLLIGNNGQQVQKQIETEPMGIKMNMSNLRAGKLLHNVNSYWGDHMPFLNQRQPTSIFTDFTNSNVDLFDFPGYEDRDTPDSYVDMLASVNSYNNYDTRRITKIAGSAYRSLTTGRQRVLTLPLQSFIPFFRGAKYLPPDFRFKFEFETNTGAMIAQKETNWIRNNGTPGATNRTPSGAYSHIIASALTQGIELQYPWFVLRQPVQAAISAQWLQKPFLYNFETIQLTEITPTEGSRNIHFAIAISTQRPTTLEIMLFPDRNYDWNPVKPTDAIWSDTLARSYLIANTPTTDSLRSGIDPNSILNGPLVWSDLEVMFSGRSAYRFRNDQYAYHANGVDGYLPYEFFIDMFEEQSMRSTATEFNAESRAEYESTRRGTKFGGLKSNVIMRLIIQPGGWTDRGVISSRQGATTITVNVAFLNALSSKTRFCVFRTNPEQCVFDSDKNVTLVQWPAIKNNSGYLLPNVTAAP